MYMRAGQYAALCRLNSLGIQFNGNTIINLQNTIWQLYLQRICLETIVRHLKQHALTNNSLPFYRVWYGLLLSHSTVLLA
jgi:hypothetical protein